MADGSDTDHGISGTVPETLRTQALPKKILLIFGWIMVLKAGLRKKDSNMYAQPYADL